MEELRNCILSDETAHGRDHPRRRIYNFIANSTLTIDAMVQCKQSNGMLSNAVFRVTTHDGDDAYLKIMPVEEYRQWRDVYDGLVRHGLQRLHPAVGRHGEVPNGADRPLFGYSVIEAFGRSIHDIEDSEGRIGRELFLDMKDFLKGAYAPSTNGDSSTATSSATGAESTRATCSVEWTRTGVVSFD